MWQLLEHSILFERCSPGWTVGESQQFSVWHGQAVHPPQRSRQKVRLWQKDGRQQTGRTNTHRRCTNHKGKTGNSALQLINYTADLKSTVKKIYMCNYPITSCTCTVKLLQQHHDLSFYYRFLILYFYFFNISHDRSLRKISTIIHCFLFYPSRASNFFFKHDLTWTGLLNWAPWK